MAEITDHESILLLRQTVDDIKVGQDRFHREMKESMNELMNNYTGRINNLDARISNENSAICTRLKKLEDAGFVIKGVMLLAGVCSALIVYIYFMQLDIVSTALETHIEQTTK